MKPLFGLPDTAKCIGIVGTRRRDTIRDKIACWAKFDEIYQEGDFIVSGGCPKGGDKFAKELAKKRGLTIITHYPNWNEYGKAAGFIRNTKIAEDCDVLIAVVAEDRTGGAEDTITKARKLGKKVVLVK